ncbi:MAG: DUF3298 and DUF4163 domain-containing protein [Bacteroidales bacterium]|nr:DUF3298 and DUF4163 domain-containing protein [Bacteroidales bacterium]MCM1415019.1 DUF3298 and DUF4163 domain-containing protein [bacterium]MCM1422873.1 DUF3298 and DUF4163 domain-containing protein [bacterium]
MKKRLISTLLSVTLLSLALSACGTSAPSEQETQNTADSEKPDKAEASSENVSDPTATDSTDNSDISDTTVTNEGADTPAAEASQETADNIKVTFVETCNEFQDDDGTVLLTNYTSMPVVSIEGADDIAAKINADIDAVYQSAASADESGGELLEWAKSDYAARKEDETDVYFTGYSQELTADVTRMDDSVLSYKLTFGEYAGGAHGNYGSVGKNYDMKTGELITFDTLSENVSDFHSAALDYFVSLSETPSYQERLFEPTKADIDSALFQTGSWYFTGSGICFFSDPYVLGPYASGEIDFTLPYEQAYEIGLKGDYRYTGPFMMERYYTSQYDADMEFKVDGKPEYSFDLNGDGTEEGIAFYNFVYSGEGEGKCKYSLYIDGNDWNDVLISQLDLSHGYNETAYVLYDQDPNDGLTEIAVLFTEFVYEDGADGSTLQSRNHYTYLFQYTPEKELLFKERLEGYITDPLRLLRCPEQSG